MVIALVTGKTGNRNDKHVNFFNEPTKIETIKLNLETEEYQTNVCPQNRFPDRVDYAAGSLWKNGQFSICGGRSIKEISPKAECRCWLFKNGGWRGRGCLGRFERDKFGRTSHGASNTGTSIWVTGGNRGKDNDYARYYSNSGRYRSTEIINPDGKITEGPDLPERRSGHCQISYRHNTYVIGECTCLDIVSPSDSLYISTL